MVKDAHFDETHVNRLWALVKDDFWGDVSTNGRRLLKELLEGSMEAWREEYVQAPWHQRSGERRDHCNGYYGRKRWKTPLGPLAEVRVPRCRGKGLTQYMLAKVQTGTEGMARSVIEMFLSGVSTRRIGELMERILDLPISAGQVSQIAKRLDGEVQRFHCRTLSDRYRFLLLDGIHLKSRSPPRLFRQPRKAKRRIVLVAYGVTHEGRKELIDFQVVRSESEANWTSFLWRLYRRGLTGESLELVCTDGCKGLCNAVEQVWPLVARQRCWFHRMSNVAGAVRRKDQRAVLEGLRRVYQAPNRHAAWGAFRRWARRWGESYPPVVERVENDLEELLAFFSVPEPFWRMVRTTNAIERYFREVRRRTRSVGMFVNDPSIERMVYGLCAYQNRKWENKVCREFKAARAVA